MSQYVRRSAFQPHHSYTLLDIKIWRGESPASRADPLFLKVHKSAPRTEALCQQDTVIYGLETRFRCRARLRADEAVHVDTAILQNEAASTRGPWALKDCAAQLLVRCQNTD